MVKETPAGDEWMHEIKFDGYRLICFISHKKIRIMTRNNNDWTAKFPALCKRLAKLNLESAILDGEVVALNKKQHSDFQILQNAIHAKDTSSLIYYAFDLLYLNGVDYSDKSLLERKTMLNTIVSAQDGMLRFSEHIIGKGEKLFKKACKLGLEGIVSKNMYSTYVQRRTHDWLKIKCSHRQEFVVLGYTKPEGQRQFFGALLMGVYNKGKKLVYCGHVGTGFNEKSLKNMHQLLHKYKSAQKPLTSYPKSLQRVTWVLPKIVIEVEFTEWTKEGSLRHPSFKGVRQDKKAIQVKREKPE